MYHCWKTMYQIWNFCYKATEATASDSRCCYLGVRRSYKKIEGKPPPRHLRRDWGVAPLCEAGATFSGSSKDLSRPQGGGDRRGFILFPLKGVRGS